MAILVTDLQGLSTVTGIHGGRGVTQWKAAGGTSMLEGDWDAIEYCALCGKATAGVHTHALTEELWFILSGRNRATLGDETVDLVPGDLVLTGIGGSHGSEQLGDEDMAMIVIAARRSGPRMWNAPGLWKGRHHVANLDGGAEVAANTFGVRGRARAGAVADTDLRRVMGAPWRGMAAITLEPGASLGPRAMRAAEAFVFVRDGAGRLMTGAEEIPIRPGHCLTFGLGSAPELRAEKRLSLFMVELGVTGRGSE